MCSGDQLLACRLVCCQLVLYYGNKITSGSIPVIIVFGCQIHKQCLKRRRRANHSVLLGYFCIWTIADLDNCGFRQLRIQTIAYLDNCVFRQLRIWTSHKNRTINKKLYSPMVHPPTCRAVRSTGVSVQRSYPCIKWRT